MQKNSKQFKYKGNYRHSLGGDDFALLPCKINKAYREDFFGKLIVVPVRLLERSE